MKRQPSSNTWLKWILLLAALKIINAVAQHWDEIVAGTF